MTQVEVCQAWELAQAAHGDLHKRGVMIESSRADRELVRNPSMMLSQTSIERVSKGLAAFGPTLEDRGRHVVPKVDSDDADNPALKAIRMTQRPR